MHIVEIKCPTYPLWEQWALPRALKKIRPDVLHCTSNTAPIYSRIPLILTLHDIIFLEKRSGTNHSLYQNLGLALPPLVVPRILRKCKKIITVSQFECNRIQNTLHLPEGVLTAIHNGYSKRFKPWNRSTRPQKNTWKRKNTFFFSEIPIRKRIPL